MAITDQYKELKYNFNSAFKRNPRLVPLEYKL